MILDLREFDTFPARATVETGPGEVSPYRDDVLDVEHIEVDLTIHKSGEEYYCQGGVKATVRLECARCLAAFSETLTGKLDFIVRSDASGDTRRSDMEDEEDYLYLHGNDMRVDPTDLVRQAIVLSTPMKPLCSDDCQGICPTCGANRNVTECECEQKKIDPRWEGLTGLTSNS